MPGSTIPVSRSFQFYTKVSNLTVITYWMSSWTVAWSSRSNRSIAFAPIHEAQLMTYLRLSGYRLGLLMNFNCTLLKDGIRRRVI